MGAISVGEKQTNKQTAFLKNWQKSWLGLQKYDVNIKLFHSLLSQSFAKDSVDQFLPLVTEFNCQKLANHGSGLKRVDHENSEI